MPMAVYKVINEFCDSARIKHPDKFYKIDGLCQRIQDHLNGSITKSASPKQGISLSFSITLFT
jgi:hypothetical protein